MTPHEVELQIIKSVVSKLDQSLEKITEVSNNISRLLAVHDERISNLEKVSTRQELDSREVQYKISNISKEIIEKINQMEDRLDIKLKDQYNYIDKYHQEINSDFKDIEQRLNALEKWRWMIIGGAAAIGFAVAQVPDVLKFIG